MQLVLQSGVLFFQLFYTEPGTYDYMNENSYILDLVSISTSGISLVYGLSSFKINVIRNEPKPLDKIVLMIRSSVDIIARYGHF